MKIVDVVEQDPVGRSQAAPAPRVNALALAAFALQVVLSVACACVIVEPDPAGFAVGEPAAPPVLTAALSPP